MAKAKPIKHKWIRSGFYRSGRPRYVRPRIERLEGKPIIGYKKALIKPRSNFAWESAIDDAAIVTLEIGRATARMQPENYKCRAARAKVVSIVHAQTGKKLKKAYSSHDTRFVYKPGETVKPTRRFDRDLDECSSGIHFFLTKKEARDYDFN